MNYSASTSSHLTNSANILNVDSQNTSDITLDTPVEPFVEVTYNGSTFFVPESMAYAYGGQTYSTLDNNTESMGNYTPAPSNDPGYVDGMGNTIGNEMERGNDIGLLEIEWSVPAIQRRTLQTVGIPSKLHDYFLMLDLETMKQMEPDDERYKELPTRYHSAQPLDDPSIPKGTYGSFGHPSSTYKVVDSTDSQVYLVRRLDNLRINPAIVKSALTKWKPVNHPCIVPLHDIAMEKGALFFSYTYHAGAQTLRQRFIDQGGPLVNESLIWRVLLQLISAVRYVHRQHRLAVRLIHPVHVILTSGSMARINGVGITDITEFESRRALADLQRDDYIRLGYLVLSLGSRALITSKNTDAALLIMRQHFSNQLNHVVNILLSGEDSTSALVTKEATDNLMNEFESSLSMGDALHSHLSNEYENGRLLRLLLKLGFVNERPDHNSSTGASSWSENGDRYILKLFRDYVFHQNDLNANGISRPLLDAGHVVTSLNKLDIGSMEQIILSSRDNKDLIIVSFADVKRCLENSISDLIQQSEPERSSPRSTLNSTNNIYSNSSISPPSRNTLIRPSNNNNNSSSSSSTSSNHLSVRSSIQNISQSSYISAPSYVPNPKLSPNLNSKSNPVISQESYSGMNIAAANYTPPSMISSNVSRSTSSSAVTSNGATMAHPSMNSPSTGAFNTMSSLHGNNNSIPMKGLTSNGMTPNHNMTSKPINARSVSYDNAPYNSATLGNLGLESGFNSGTPSLKPTAQEWTPSFGSTGAASIHTNPNSNVNTNTNTVSATVSSTTNTAVINSPSRSSGNNSYNSTNNTYLSVSNSYQPEYEYEYDYNSGNNPGNNSTNTTILPSDTTLNYGNNQQNTYYGSHGSGRGSSSVSMSNTSSIHPPLSLRSSSVPMIVSKGIPEQEEYYDYYSQSTIAPPSQSSQQSNISYNQQNSGSMLSSQTQLQSQLQPQLQSQTQFPSQSSYPGSVPSGLGRGMGRGDARSYY